MQRPAAHMQRPTAYSSMTRETNITNCAPHTSVQTLRTPTTVTSFNDVRRRLKSKLDVLDDQSKLCLEKIAHAAEKVFADSASLSSKEARHAVSGITSDGIAGLGVPYGLGAGWRRSP